MTTKPIDILLVEDSPGDVELIREGLNSSRLLNQVHVATDGVEAMNYLKEAPENRPDLILLDINLPRKNGHEVLAEMRSDPVLKSIPVVILTTSDHDDDILRAYECHASAYVQKPLKAGEFIDVIRGIEGFWLSIVKLPPKAPE